MSEPESPEVVARLEFLDRKLERLLDLIVGQRTIKDSCTTAEVAAIIGKAEFTVREYCRLRRIKGQKRACGRGKHPAWIDAREELVRRFFAGSRPGPQADVSGDAGTGP